MEAFVIRKVLKLSYKSKENTVVEKPVLLLYNDKSKGMHCAVHYF